MDEFNTAVALFLSFTAAACLWRAAAAPDRAARMQAWVLLAGNLAALAAVGAQAAEMARAIDLTLVALMVATLASVVWPRQRPVERRR